MSVSTKKRNTYDPVAAAEQARSAAGRVAEQMDGLRAHISKLQQRHRDDVAAAMKRQHQPETQ